MQAHPTPKRLVFTNKNQFPDLCSYRQSPGTFWACKNSNSLCCRWKYHITDKLHLEQIEILAFAALLQLPSKLSPAKFYTENDNPKDLRGDWKIEVGTFFLFSFVGSSVPIPFSFLWFFFHLLFPSVIMVVMHGFFSTYIVMPTIKITSNLSKVIFNIFFIFIFFAIEIFLSNNCKPTRTRTTALRVVTKYFIS